MGVGIIWIAISLTPYNTTKPVGEWVNSGITVQRGSNTDSCSDVEWFQFGMAFQNWTARPFQIQPNSCLHGFLYFGSILNGWDYSYSCSYGPDHTNTQPLPIRTSKRSDFEWVLNFIVWYLSPHCIAINRWAWIHIDIIWQSRTILFSVSTWFVDFIWESVESGDMHT